MPAGNGVGGTNCRGGSDTIDSPFFPLHPFYDDRIIMVTSTDINDNHIWLNGSDSVIHSFYPEVDICAPGYDLMGATSTQRDTCDGSPVCCESISWPYYEGLTGTSFATPIVAGTCALMKSVNSNLTPAQAEDIIKKTADSVNDAHLFPGMVGAGRINAYCAVYQSQPITLINNLSGFYKKYFINISDAIINSSTTIKAGEVIINGPFEANAAFSIEIASDFNCF